MALTDSDGATRTKLDVAATLSPSNTVFGPGDPLVPQGNQPPRVWDFPVSVNTIITPRAYETTPAALRAYANIEAIRLCIETRKDQMEALSWTIVPKGKKVQGKPAPKGNETKIAAMTAFWERPDGNLDFATWLRTLLEDLLVGDWPALERRRTLGGGFGGAGKLLGLDVLPGDTIHPMVDATGRRPRGRFDVAYQQVIKGRPWVNMTNADLIYAPRNPRPGHNYGLSPVEQIVVTINTTMRRQAAQLAYFTEGNTPAGFITGPDGWTAEQLVTFQAMLDDRIGGSQAAQAKLLMMPNGAKYQAFKDSPLKDDFDEWLYRIACFAFSLPPTPFIKAMNRSTAETDKERAQQEGLLPLKLWFKRLADRVMLEDFGIADHEWAWDDDTDIDPNLQSEMDDRDLRNGSRTWDEVRDRRGDAAYPNGIGDKPAVITATGIVLIEQGIEPPEPPPAPIMMHPGDNVPVDPTIPSGGPPKPSKGTPKQAANGKAGNAKTSGHGGKDTASATEKLEKSAKPEIDVDRPVPRRAIKALTKTFTTVLQAVGDDVAVHVSRSIRGLAKASDADTLAANIALAEKLAASAGLDGLNEAIDDFMADLTEVVIDSATAGLAQVGASASDELLGQVHARAVAYANQRGAELVATGSPKGIMDSTRNAIRQTIVDGLNDAKTGPQIADDIQASQAFSPERAKLIAETEIKNANSQGVLEAYRQAVSHGIGLQKYWVTNGEDTCCDECAGNEAEGPIDVDQPFSSGDDCPTAHPNCNCTMNSVFVAPDGDETETDDE